MHTSVKTFARAALGAAILSLAGLSLAHPALISSSPKAGDALDMPPREIRLKFNDPIEITFTHVKVFDAARKEIAVEATQRDPSDTSAAVQTLPPLKPGSYKASWTAVGRDGHRVKGEFNFSVK